ncbi:hypothetical protein VRK_28400 [Vibrio sp. MEBiC08052]|nr:hypothetical protein VRK_28400 [Vibrio sp. MEBiC08052]
MTVQKDVLGGHLYQKFVTFHFQLNRCLPIRTELFVGLITDSFEFILGIFTE